MVPYFAQNLHLWYPGYLKSVARKRKLPPPTTVWVMIGDHYEPYWRGADRETAHRRVKQWHQEWPRIAARHRDTAGKPPRYTFFYPEEEYDSEILDMLAELSREQIGDVEVHLHHDHDTEPAFLDRMRRFLETLHVRHGLLREVDGKLGFGFIHGNWALDNSRPDGRWCGLNNEISLLKELGCYADFTLPSAPHASQTRMVNTIYWATDDPGRSKSHNTGAPLETGQERGDLLIVPGPLGLNARGSRRLLPRLETGELAWHDPPVRGRAASWLRLAPQVGEHIFIKLFSHGTQEQNAQMLLGDGLDVCLDDVAEECGKQGLRLFFASAWEMNQGITTVFA